MRLRNRDGDPIDPVPYLVVAGIGFGVVFVFFPGYGLAVGLDASLSLALAGIVFVGVAGYAYYEMVWTNRPDVRREVPVELRVRRLFYAAIIAGLVLTVLSLLLLVP